MAEEESEEDRILSKINMENAFMDDTDTTDTEDGGQSSNSGNTTPVTLLNTDGLGASSQHAHARVVRSATWATPRGEPIPETAEEKISRANTIDASVILNAKVANPIASPRTLETTLSASIVSTPPVAEEPTELPSVEKDFRSCPQVCAFNCNVRVYFPIVVPASA